MKKRTLLICLVSLMLIGFIQMIGKKEDVTDNKNLEITVDMDSLDSLGAIGETELSTEDRQRMTYYTSMEEALAANPQMFDEKPYAARVDTQIKSFETDTEAILFYLSFESKTKGSFVVAKFQKQVSDEGDEYAVERVSSSSEISKWGIGYEKNPEKNVRFSLNTATIKTMMGYTVFKENRFLWGITKLEEVNHLKIDGQKPDGVVSYDQFGTPWYFWYFENLDSEANLDDLSIEFLE